VPVIDETWFVRPEGVRTRLSAGGIIVRRDDEGRIFVALVRGEGSGKEYILPKGGVDRGESIEQAARREIEEEAGLGRLRFLARIGPLSRLSYDRRRWITTHYFLFSTDQVDTNPTDPHVPYATDWHAIDGPLPVLFWPEQQRLLEEWIPRIPEFLDRARRH
jgi:8-oxo-dGTP pyrophosphatase MutT (NUDIX family)